MTAPVHSKFFICQFSHQNMHPTMNNDGDSNVISTAIAFNHNGGFGNPIYCNIGLNASIISTIAIFATLYA